MAAVTICSDFGAQKNKVSVSIVSPSICNEVMGPNAIILVDSCYTFVKIHRMHNTEKEHYNKVSILIHQF